MKVKVIKYNDYNVHPTNCHVCEDENGREMYIDLMVNGDFPDKEPDFLIGKIVEIQTHPYVSIADEVRIVE